MPEKPDVNDQLGFMIHQASGLKSSAKYAEYKGFITITEYADLIAVLGEVQSVMENIRSAQIERGMTFNARQ